jgi:phage terminase large subunit-like protein
MPQDLENWLLIGALDPTAKGGKNNDLSAWVELLFHPKSKRMIISYIDARQRNYDETIGAVSQRILGNAKRYYGILVEENSIGYAVASEIEKIIAPYYYQIQKINNKIPKQERIDTLSTYIPREQLTTVSDINPELFRELDSFPANGKDDVLDAVSMIVSELRKTGKLDMNPYQDMRI